MNGVVRTRVGYTGGTTQHPTYHSLGNHTEAIQIDYDPDIISYRELLTIFWESHNPERKAWSIQYRAAIFTHDDHQRSEAKISLEQIRREKGTVYTEILPLATFYPAEDYHQKYYLRGNRALAFFLRESFNDPVTFRNSTLAARLNAYSGGYLKDNKLMAALQRDGIPEEVIDRLRSLLNVPNSKPLTCTASS